MKTCKTKIISIILAAVMAAVCFAGCAGGESDGESRTTTAAPGNNTVPGEEESGGRIATGLPKKDFGGYTFKILGNSEQFHEHWYSRDLYAEEPTGDTINDAIYERNLAIEEEYNIDIKVNYSAKPADDARINLMAGGGDMYDLFSIQLEGTAQILAQGGYLSDLNKIEYLNLDQPWWDQNAKKQLSIGGALFMTVNDLTIVDKDAVFMYLFNKELHRDLGLESPYNLVRENKWTVDALYGQIKAATSDLDGNDEMNEFDRYGNLSETNAFYQIVLGADQLFIDKDENDLPVPALDNQTLIRSFEKWIEIQNDRHNTMMAQDWMSKYPGNAIWDLHLAMLSDKRALFMYTGMNRVTMLRQMDFEFGILPTPKLDVSQEHYSNAVHSWCATAVSIPKASPNLERTGIILEALTAESYYTLRPAYYDVSLKTKLIRDDESYEMLDLIFASRTYDLGQIYNFGNLYSSVVKLANEKSTNFASMSEKVYGSVESAIAKTVAAFENME